MYHLIIISSLVMLTSAHVPVRRVLQTVAFIIFVYQSVLALVKYLDSPTIDISSQTRNSGSYYPRKRKACNSYYCFLLDLNVT